MTAPSPFMQQALDAAAAVRGVTSPNPWVGAVLVHEGQVVSVGATAAAGGMHAEAAVLAGNDARDTDLYVTVEPCVAFPGKRTQPCTDAIVTAGCKRVVVAIEDPDPRVRGQGITALRRAGVEVTLGDGAEAAQQLLRPYIKQRQTGQPYVVAKFAASLDGRTATRTGDSKWITGETARDRVHHERARVDAILTGSGTVLADDPELTARPGGELAARQPVRVVLDARGRVPPTAKLFSGPGATIVATTCAADPGWKRAIAARGAAILEVEPDPAGVSLEPVLAALGARGILSVWAEAGATVLGSLFDGGHVDEVWAFVAPILIGGSGLAAVGGAGADLVSQASRLRSPQVELVGDDVLVRGYTGNWSP